MHTAKKAQNFSIANINFLLLFKEIIAVYSENDNGTDKYMCRRNDC
jgi:hypothetical protein